MRRTLFAIVLAVVSLASTAAAFSGGVGAAGSIITVAGSGVHGRNGDGGPATAAELRQPRGIAVLPDGGFVFAESDNHDVRRVLPSGAITTVAGVGTPGYSGDGGPATSAELDFVHGVAVLPGGALLIADEQNNRIRRVDAGGTMTTVAGTGKAGFSGDGGPAVLARINSPRGIAALPGGGFLVPDTNNHRVRRVSLDGTITTVAGTGVAGFAGDGGQAIAAELNLPFGVAPLKDGGFLIADAGNRRVRRVWPDGKIATVAGTGIDGYSGDGGNAVAAEMTPPINVAVMPDGGFLVADTANQRVRRVWPDGTITTFAGTGVAGFAGDGEPLAGAVLNQPKAMAVTPAGAILVADSGNDRVRLITPPAPQPPSLVAVRFGRKGRAARVTFRACDTTRAQLIAEVRQSRAGLATSVIRRTIPSSRGGCRLYRLAWRLPTSRGRFVERLQVRSQAGLSSNTVLGGI